MSETPAQRKGGLPIRRTDALLSLGLAFVGGYGDGTGFVLAKTFTGHVTGNLVLAAISIAANDWRGTFKHLSAVLTFLTGTLLGVLIERPLKAWSSWPLLPTVMGIEVALIGIASLASTSHVGPGAEIFVVCVSLALGLQNGAFRRAGGMSVHTTYVTGLITSLITTGAEKYASQAGLQPVLTSDPKINLLSGMWVAFFLGAGIGAAMVFHFKGLGMLGAALPLITLILHSSKGSHA
jgi:uncharacterized membrane protein YoaK (UPF0700 family)